MMYAFHTCFPGFRKRLRRRGKWRCAVIELLQRLALSYPAILRLRGGLMELEAPLSSTISYVLWVSFFAGEILVDKVYRKGTRASEWTVAQTWVDDTATTAHEYGMEGEYPYIGDIAVRAT